MQWVNGKVSQLIIIIERGIAIYIVMQIASHNCGFEFDFMLHYIVLIAR